MVKYLKSNHTNLNIYQIFFVIKTLPYSNTIKKCAKIQLFFNISKFFRKKVQKKKRHLLCGRWRGVTQSGLGA